MKKFLVVSCLFVFAFMASAQGGQGGGQRQGGQGGGRQQTPEAIAEQQAQWKKDLNLDDKQFAEFKKIDDEARAKQQAARQGGNFDRDAMTKLREEQTTKIKAVLTADQFKKYEELSAQRRQGGGGGGGNRQN